MGAHGDFGCYKNCLLCPVLSFTFLSLMDDGSSTLVYPTAHYSNRGLPKEGLRYLFSELFKDRVFFVILLQAGCTNFLNNKNYVSLVDHFSK